MISYAFVLFQKCREIMKRFHYFPMFERPIKKATLFDTILSKYIYDKS